MRSSPFGATPGVAAPFVYVDGFAAIPWCDEEKAI